MFTGLYLICIAFIFIAFFAPEFDVDFPERVVETAFILAIVGIVGSCAFPLFTEGRNSVSIERQLMPIKNGIYAEVDTDKNEIIVIVKNEENGRIEKKQLDYNYTPIINDSNKYPCLMEEKPIPKIPQKIYDFLWGGVGIPTKFYIYAPEGATLYR